jgi:hypothetical protein
MTDPYNTRRSPHIRRRIVGICMTLIFIASVIILLSHAIKGG